MSQVSIVTLASHTVHPGTAGIAAEYIGSKQHAASYYITRSRTQTLSWSLGSTGINTFEGDIVIQCSLSTDPTENEWFDVYTIDSITQKSGFYNIEGNFVWARAVVSNWTAGTIELISLSY